METVRKEDDGKSELSKSYGKEKLYMYLYESHLGGLYADDELFDWTELYCEECGDSDRVLGTFDAENPETLWNMIKPSRLACIGCEVEPDCLLDCNHVDSTGSDYDLLYCMQFIASSTKTESGEKLILICRNASNGKIFVNFHPKGRKFGEKHSLPSSFCLFPELEQKVILSLIPNFFELEGTPSFIANEFANGKKISIWECSVIPDSEDSEEGAWSYADGRYGWLNPDDFDPIKEQEPVSELLKKKN